MSARISDPIDAMVGAKIRIFRKNRKISQTELAERIGVTFQQVQKYEKGTNRVGSSRLSRIAAVLGISVGELFASSEEEPADATSPFRLLAEPGALRVLKSYARASDPSVRHAIAELVEDIANQHTAATPGAATKPEVSLDIHDRWLRGQNLMAKYDPESWQQAVTIFRIAIRENPTFSPCYSSLVQMNNIEHFVHPGSFRDRDKAKATLELANTAVQLDPADPRAHLCCGWSYALALRAAEAAPHMDLACELNDSDPWTLLSNALYRGFCGSIELARLLAEQSLALSPVPSHLEWGYHGLIRFLCGNYAGAVEALDRAQDVISSLPAWRAAALFYLGEPVRAREEGQRFLSDIRLLWAGSSAPTDEAVTRWVLHAFPITRHGRWEAFRRGLGGAGLAVEGISSLS